MNVPTQHRGHGAGSGRLIAVILAVWAALALLMNLTGGLYKGPKPLPQILIFGLFTAGTLAFFKVPSVNHWGHSVDLRWLTLFHAWRVLPALAFFYFHYHLGKLPSDFVNVAGYGDLAVALLAPLAAFLAGSPKSYKWKAVAAFHLFGMFDLFTVVITATKNVLRNPESLHPLRELPLGLLPTILVPLTLIAHVIALAQIRRRTRGAPDL